MFEEARQGEERGIRLVEALVFVGAVSSTIAVLGGWGEDWMLGLANIVLFWIFLYGFDVTRFCARPKPANWLNALYASAITLLVLPSVLEAPIRREALLLSGAFLLAGFVFLLAWTLYRHPQTFSSVGAGRFVNAYAKCGMARPDTLEVKFLWGLLSVPMPFMVTLAGVFAGLFPYLVGPLFVFLALEMVLAIPQAGWVLAVVVLSIWTGKLIRQRREEPERELGRLLVESYTETHRMRTAGLLKNAFHPRFVGYLFILLLCLLLAVVAGGIIASILMGIPGFPFDGKAPLLVGLELMVLFSFMLVLLGITAILSPCWALIKSLGGKGAHFRGSPVGCVICIITLVAVGFFRLGSPDSLVQNPGKPSTLRLLADIALFLGASMVSLGSFVKDLWKGSTTSVAEYGENRLATILTCLAVGVVLMLSASVDGHSKDVLLMLGGFIGLAYFWNVFCRYIEEGFVGTTDGVTARTLGEMGVLVVLFGVVAWGTNGLSPTMVGLVVGGLVFLLAAFFRSRWSTVKASELSRLIGIEVVYRDETLPSMIAPRESDASPSQD